MMVYCVFDKGYETDELLAIFKTEEDACEFVTDLEHLPDLYISEWEVEG